MASARGASFGPRSAPLGSVPRAGEPRLASGAAVARSYSHPSPLSAFTPALPRLRCLSSLSRADGFSLGGCSTPRVRWIPSSCPRQTHVCLVAWNAAEFALPHALLSSEMNFNPPPSGVQHAGFFVWVTGQGVIHADGAKGLDKWCTSVAAAGRWTHLNMQMLVGDVRKASPLSSPTCGASSALRRDPLRSTTNVYIKSRSTIAP